MRLIGWASRLVALYTLFVLLLYAVAVPLFYRELRDTCAFQTCKAFYNPPPGREWLQAQGLTSSDFAGAYTALYVIFTLLFVVAAAVLYKHKRRDIMGLFGIVMLINLAVTFIPVLDVFKDVHPALTLFINGISVVGMPAFVLFMSIFPNGRFEPRWSRWLVLVLIAVRVPGIAMPGTIVDLNNWKPLFGIWFAAWIGTNIGLLIYRYRKVLQPTEKLQTKWAIYGCIMALSGLASWTVVYVINQSAWDANPYLLYVLEIGIQFSMCALPVTLLVALLRFRLWNIDPLVNRTLVYGMLTVCIILVYAGSVSYLSLMFQLHGSRVVSFLAAALIAVLFQPLRERLQRLVSQWMYGEQGDPLATLASLGERLAEPLPPEETLRAVARSVKEAIRLPYVGIILGQAKEPAAEVGERQAEVRELPLVHRGQRVGGLLLPLREGEHADAGERRTGAVNTTAAAAISPPAFAPASAEGKLFELLGRHAGVVVHGVQASYEVQQLAADLQDSRERLILAREEERRRLRRNLHDDLAPQLAALLYTSSAAEQRIDDQPDSAKAMLAELRKHIRRTIADIRMLVYDLRPPALDELGLIGAIGERIADLSGAARSALAPQAGTAAPPSMRIEFDAPAPEALPPLPAAVEVAAYRIATEALVNVAKHAGASVCSVRLRASGGRLDLEIRDDGRAGTDYTTASATAPLAAGSTSASAAAASASARTNTGGGLGQASMRERAAELGGVCRIESLPEGGTVVSAWLPYEEEQQQASPAAEEAAAG